MYATNYNFGDITDTMSSNRLTFEPRGKENHTNGLCVYETVQMCYIPKSIYVHDGEI